MAEPCHAAALEQLRRAAPEGYAIYEKLQDKKHFTIWIKCDDIQLGLTTAIHEGTHILTDEVNGYPLISGGVAPRVLQSKRFFPPKMVARQFNQDSSFVGTYMKPGAATSAEEFGFLLDELNAYSHDLNAAVRLARLADPNRDVFHRDGLAALMAFVAAYVEHARADEGTTWTALKKPDVRRSISILWAQAENVMGSSCRMPRYALEAREYLAPVCAANIRHGLGELLGRPPLCPVSCLRATADAGR
jgi:hypothetical protein